MHFAVPSVPLFNRRYRRHPAHRDILYDIHKLDYLRLLDRWRHTRIQVAVPGERPRKRTSRSHLQLDMPAPLVSAIAGREKHNPTNA